MPALSALPTLNFDGNDGPWSTFAIQIGTSQAQPVAVLPATSKSNIWAVLGPEGCSYTSSLRQLDDCVSFREGLYYPNNSASFQKLTCDNDKYCDLPFFGEQALGYAGTSVAGTDIVGFGWSGNDIELLQEQAISAFAYTDPWLAIGLLGLSDQPLNVTGPTDLHPSPLGTLRNSTRIPSSFWAYNAGARYAQPPVYGSLTLGGFDKARGNIKKDGLKLDLQQNNFRDTVVSVSGIHLVTDSGTVQAMDSGGPFEAYIDSVVPELWLPASVCRVFESRFGLQWNSTAEMYLVDDAENQRLYDEHASVTITLVDPGDAAETVEIVFPYSAFDLEARYPLAGIQDDSVLRYFPLKQANDSSQYTLGRTFLQEASVSVSMFLYRMLTNDRYLAVDYDRSAFYVTQATLSADTDIKTVHPSDAGLSNGVIAGIVVGVIGGVSLVAFAIWYVFRIHRPRQKRKRNSRFRARIEAENADLPDTQLPPKDDNTEMEEFYGKRPFSPDSDHRQELDASKTARGSVGTRAELESPSPGSAHGTPKGKLGRRESYGFPSSPAELDSRSPRMMHSRTASGSSFGQLSPTDTIGRNELERTEELHELP